MFDFTPERIASGVAAYFVLLFSLSFHEAAHAWMALRMGDDTAAREGRITLNPFPHIDPVGTVLFPLLQIFGGNIPLLAWAKPTPVAGHNLKRLARGHILVAAAGPVSNLILAVFFAVALFLVAQVGLLGDPAVSAIIGNGILINVMLGIFNLIPIPPLDGSWIASWGLPREWGNRYDSVMEPYGFLILMALYVLLYWTHALAWIVVPIARFIEKLALVFVA